MAATATSNAITLKGSTEIVAEFFRKDLFLQEDKHMFFYLLYHLLLGRKQKTDYGTLQFTACIFHYFDKYTGCILQLLA